VPEPQPTVLVLTALALEYAAVRAHAEDRRRNLIELTEAGRDTLRRADDASRDAERRFLAPLSARDAGQLKAVLLALIQPGR